MSEQASAANTGEVKSQTSYARYECGSHTMHEQLLATDGAYRNSHTRTCAVLDQTEPCMDKLPAIVRIPVVVHVIWNKESDKLTPEQVKAQIDVLNTDFQMRNRDVEDVPIGWKAKVGNPSISFFLTSRDDKGYPSSSVISTKSDIKVFGHRGAKRNGEPMAWPHQISKALDPYSFLNIWVVPNLENAQGGTVLGYATFPSIPLSDTDGVVINRNAFGVNLPGFIPGSNLGRTLTHEVGHYFNLPHVFDEYAGRVGYTVEVPVDKANFGKPLYPNISEFEYPRRSGEKSNEKDGGDMFMNFMDYCDDDVLVMFTQGQVKVMREALLTLRPTLFWSNFGLTTQIYKTSFEADQSSQYSVLDFEKSTGHMVAIKPVPGNRPGWFGVTLALQTLGSNYTVHRRERALPTSDDTMYNYRWCLGLGWNNKICALALKSASSVTQIFVWDLQTIPTPPPLHQKNSPLPEITSNWHYLLANWSTESVSDLVAIKRFQTVNKKIEIHVLSAESKYSRWLAHKYTALDECKSDISFLMTDWNGDGTLDLVAIRKSDENDKWIVNILAGAADYREFLVKSEIPDSQLSTLAEYDFVMRDMTGSGRPDLVAIQKTRLAKDAGGQSYVRVIVLAA